ncbi:MAG: dipeptide/oligopeptide/nickel ABC transporter permease/ATP-binding protein [Euzebya sp.]
MSLDRGSLDRGPLRLRSDSSRIALWVGIGILVGLATMALLAPLLAPYNPDLRVGPPFSGPTGRFLLGTNDVGGDLLSELIYGARVSLAVGVAAAVLGTAIGTVVGVLAGSGGRVVDAVLMRIVDMVLVLPLVPLTIVVGVFLGPGLGTQIAVITAVMWARPARELRSQALSLRQQDDIRAIRMMGGGQLYLLRYHLLPRMTAIVVPQLVIAAKTAILLEAALSFLGLGDPGARSWGTTLSLAYQRNAFLTGAWVWWVVPPGVCIAATVLGFALIGTWFEPRRSRPGVSPPAVVRASAHEVSAPSGLSPVQAQDLPWAEAVAAVRGLTVVYTDRVGHTVTAVDGADLVVGAGQAVGLVGASGSGKSSLVAAALGLLPPTAHAPAGQRWLSGHDLDRIDPARLRGLLGDRVAVIPQDAQQALNPVIPIGRQIAEAITAHHPRARGAAAARDQRDKVMELMDLVDLPTDRIDAYPHELSGGMRQRVVIAMALANDPDLLVADEPTSGLDVILAADLVGLLARLRRQRSLALLLVSHDLPLVLGLVDEVVVIDRGQVVESGPVGRVATAPRHPVTRALLEAMPPLVNASADSAASAPRGGR